MQKYVIAIHFEFANTCDSEIGSIFGFTVPNSKIFKTKIQYYFNLNPFTESFIFIPQSLSFIS